MAPLPTNTVISQRYTVLKFLGGGGFGEVYSVSRAGLDKPLALKLFRERVAVGEAQFEKVKREALAVNAVAERTLHVPRVYEGGIDATLQRAWFVMDQLDGCSLADLMQRRVVSTGRGLSLPEAHTVLSGVADALRAAHAQDLVHCDLKPENIYVARSTVEGHWCMPYVLDFGVAKRRTDLHTHQNTTAHGTLPWMAPEQLEGGHITPAVDQWSFAQIVYWMFVGERFPPTEVQRSSPARWAMSRGVLIPAAFDQWFERATRSAPNERYPSLTEAYEVLAALGITQNAVAKAPATPVVHAQQTPLQPAALAPAKRASSALVAFASVSVVLVGGGVLGVLSLTELLGSRSSPPSSRTRPQDSWSPSLTAELRQIERGFDTVQSRPDVDTAVRLWKSFVENHGGGPVTIADVYMPSARIRMNQTDDSTTYQHWWQRWAEGGSRILVHTDAARWRLRAYRTDGTDNADCADRGALTEVRVPVSESLRGRAEAEERAQPYADYTAIYTIRFVGAPGALRVCHENWRERDFCPRRPLARGCASQQAERTDPL